MGEMTPPILTPEAEEELAAYTQHFEDAVRSLAAALARMQDLDSVHPIHIQNAVAFMNYVKERRPSRWDWRDACKTFGGIALGLGVKKFLDFLPHLAHVNPNELALYTVIGFLGFAAILVGQLISTREYTLPIPRP